MKESPHPKAKMFKLSQNSREPDEPTQLKKARRSHSVAGSLSCSDVRSHRFFVQLNPPFRDQTFSFLGHFVANPATHFTENERGIRPKCKKQTSKIQLCCVEQVRRLQGGVRPFGSIFFLLTSIAARFLATFLIKQTFF